MNPVANRGALVHQGRAARGEARLSSTAGVGTQTLEGNRNEELCKHPGVDLVGFDVGLGDGFGFHWVGDDDLGDVGPDQPDERPGVAGDFDGEAVGRAKVNGGELADGLGGRRRSSRCSASFHHGEDVKCGDFFMEIDADKPGLAVVGGESGRGRIGLGFRFGFSFGEFMAINSMRLSQGLAPLCLST